MSKSDNELLLPEWQEAIDHAALAIEHDVNRRIIWEITYNDDMERPLTEEEISKRFLRVSGDAVCSFCGERYEDHPNEIRLLSYDGHPYLKRLCAGTLGKT